MIPSIKIVLAGPLAAAAAICLGVGVILVGLKTDFVAMPRLAEIAQIGVAVIAVYAFNWIDNEWRSFDERAQKVHGEYFPIEDLSEAKDENLFVTMAMSAMIPSAEPATNDEDTATLESFEEEVEKTEAITSKTSRSSFLETTTLWHMVLNTGVPFNHVSRRSFVLESQTS